MVIDYAAAVIAAITGLACGALAALFWTGAWMDVRAWWDGDTEAERRRLRIQRRVERMIRRDVAMRNRKAR